MASRLTNMNDILEEIENIAPKGFVSESQKCGKATKEDPIPKHAPLLLMDRYCHRKSYEAKQGKISWRCCEAKCPCNVHTFSSEIGKHTAVYGLGHHDHMADFTKLSYLGLCSKAYAPSLWYSSCN